MKRGMPYCLWILVVCTISCARLFAQDAVTLPDRILSLPDKVFGRIDKEASSLEAKVNKQSEKYLRKLEKQEQKLRRSLWKKDTAKAKELFGDQAAVKNRYDQLRQSLRQKESQASSITSSVYSGHIDSLTTAMQFLKSSPLLQESNALSKQLDANLQKVNQLQRSVDGMDYIRKELQHRQEQLKQQLQQTGLVKEFRKYKKQVYYYQQQAREYQDILNDPNRLGAELLTAAMKFPAFREFFRNNSVLSSLFSIPGSGSAQAGMASFAGLQTRNDLQNMLQQRFGNGATAQQYLQQQMQAAQGEMNKLKNKLNDLGGGNSEMDMPDFKPNMQKTKSLRKRIELGGDLQTTRGNYFFPMTSDIAVKAGLKLRDDAVVGLSASYKLGLGQNWQNIKISHQGMGLRTYLEWKMPTSSKGGKLLRNLWVSGGAEMNYRSWIERFEVLKDYSRWQKTALIGISRKYQVTKKLKGNAQMLYDIFWRSQVPRTQPVVFRLGYVL